MSSKSRRVPAEQRQRTEHSCDRCKSRKQKCNRVPGQEKCKHCLKYGYDCAVTKPRKHRLRSSIEAAYVLRMTALEGLVKGLLPEADLSTRESLESLGRELGIVLPVVNASAVPTEDDGQRSQMEDVDGPSEECAAEDEDEPGTGRLVHDRQGQSQYIGRSSSYFFHMKLRALVGFSHHDGERMGQMQLFGPNPADQSTAAAPSSCEGLRPRRGSDVLAICPMGSPASSESLGSTPSIASPGSAFTATTTAAATAAASNATIVTVQTRRAAIMRIVRAFFDRVNVDYPVLHEAAFLEALETWCRSPASVDQVWLCSFLCVLLLGRRHCSDSGDLVLADQREEEAQWWAQVQSSLPKVMFTSSLASVQALMLASLHLHNTNSRDIGWTLTGAAVRIGFAIGLHRDDIETDGTPLVRELRKKVWWTLYSFEQLQVSSYDRPSAMNDIRHLAGSPREGLLGMAANNLPEYAAWSNRLAVLLGRANALPEAAKSNFSGPLSPVPKLLRDLDSWRRALPPHLSVESLDSMPPPFQRSIVLLHVQYHYTVSFVSRSALLARFTAVSKDDKGRDKAGKGGRRVAFSDSQAAVADTCVDSGRESCRLLLKIEAIGKFNAISWFDVYYLYSSALILVLSIICDAMQGKAVVAGGTGKLMDGCRALSSKYLADERTPGTMRRWLSIVCELHSMVNHFVANLRASQGGGPTSARLSTRVPAPACQAWDRRTTPEPSPRYPHTSDVEYRGHRRLSGIKTPDTTEAFVVNPFASADTSTATASATPTDLQFPALPSLPEWNYGYAFPFGVPEESRGWPEMHWEDISDMLLGAEPGTWCT
ncbi:hypothetical protein VTK73DRAFT_3291 [Phialemonium thermophilum]|uniref:Zn(2)-C6 fungal-type domain-containing protein n=1 Tax=Phialemonium thermophilum TaxID=223376 RepID=A0ABR3Y200_9PEZI